MGSIFALTVTLEAPHSLFLFFFFKNIFYKDIETEFAKF